MAGRLPAGSGSIRGAFAALAVSVAVSAFAETSELDLTVWQKSSVQTNGWTLTGLEKYAAGTLGGAAYFNGADDTIVSPTVASPIRTVTVESATLSGSLTRGVRLVPLVNGVEGEALTLDPPTGADFVAQVIDISARGATAVYLRSSSGSGNWAVRKIRVAYGEEDPAGPSEESETVVAPVDGVSVGEATPDGFALSWLPVAGAKDYIVSVWTNGVIGAEAGTEVLGERFSKVPSRDYKSKWTLDDLNAVSDYGQWSGELVRGYECAEGEDPGVVLGTESALGHLLSGPIAAAGDLQIRLRLTRHTEKDSVPVLVGFVRDGETNFSDTVVLGTDVHSFNDYVVTATNVASGSRLLISTQYRASGSSCGRVAVGGVSVVAGYSAGTAATLPVADGQAVAEGSFAVERAVRATYGYSVAARYEIDGTNACSVAVTGEIDMANPPWMNCWRVSEFLPQPGRRLLDLSGYGKVVKQFDWTNGCASDGLYAFANGTAVDKCRAYSESATYGGIYCYDAGTEAASTNAIALFASGSTELKLLLPVRLDSARKLTSFGLSFVARQLNPGWTATELCFEWAVFDDLAAMTEPTTEWREAGVYVAGDTPGKFVLAVPKAAVRSARYACFRWRVAAQANSAMIGLSDVCATATQREDGFAIIVR